MISAAGLGDRISKYMVVARKPNPDLVSLRAAFCAFEKTLPLGSLETPGLTEPQEIGSVR